MTDHRLPYLIDVGAQTGVPPASPVTASLEHLTEYGITGGVAAALPAKLHDAERGNQELVRTLSGLPAWRPCWTLTAGIDRRPAEARAQVAAGLAAGAVAFTLHPRTHDFDASLLEGALAELADRRTPLLVEHPELEWSALDALASEYPELPVVLSHVGYRSLRRLAPLFHRHPFLLLNTVNFTSHQGIDWFAAEFGAKRLLYGSGIPVRDPGEALTQLAWSDLDDAEVALVAHGNAERLFGLSPADAGPRPQQLEAQPDRRSPALTGPGAGETGLREDVLARRPTARRVIDAHAHEGPYSLFHIPDPDASGMVAVMDRTGVDIAIVASNRAIQQDAHLGNDQSLHAVDAFPDRFRAHAVINPWQDPEKELERVRDDPRFVGIKLHPDLHEYPLSGPRYRAVWDYSERTGCPVLTHTWYGSRTSTPAILREVAERTPGITVLLGHAGALPAGFDEAIETARVIPGAFLEICGSSMNARFLRALIDGVGAGRVVFGSDFPFIDQRSSLGRVVFSDLDEAELVAVLSGNADALFAWRGHPLPGTANPATARADRGAHAAGGEPSTLPGGSDVQL